MAQLTALGTDAAAPTTRPASKPVLMWAAIGVVWTIVSIVTLYGWVTGDDFGAPEVRGPDQMDAGKLIGLRIVEVISTGVLAIAVYFLAWKPWRRDKKVTLDALLLLGGITGFVMDCWLNTQSFLFAFNSHSVNLGAWSSSLPFHNDAVPSHYAESLLWGLPMYIYFCAALGFVNTMAARRIRARWPGLSTQSILAILFVGDLVFDFVVENVIIRTTEAYSFVQTSGPLTLWDGEQHQFPLYETFLVACVAMCFTYARWSADWDADGLSVIERGVLTIPSSYRLAVRTFAAIGFCAVVLMMCYHLPFNWISLTGDSFADLPSYLAPAGLTLP
ncbi:spirocyclase AveC family protein [Nocardioides sp. WS12]|uniref:spirocyclase AveC family protein n=1 Tax=Nocardioides sp. WS12 TaxID=2486272 RepID=UPI0015FC5049|nr:spirocyclase AveC family protein [Nocardioides sp. WS12]